MKDASCFPWIRLLCRTVKGLTKSFELQRTPPHPAFGRAGRAGSQKTAVTFLTTCSHLYLHTNAHTHQNMCLCAMQIRETSKIDSNVLNFERYLTSSLNDSNINEKRVNALYAKRWESDLRHRVSQTWMATQRRPLFLSCLRTPIHI